MMRPPYKSRDISGILHDQWNDPTVILVTGGKNKTKSFMSYFKARSKNCEQRL